jgi:16S rRNA (uracil1498-N3)-methyltransferase
MDLFYTPNEKIDLKSGRLSIDGEEFHHLVRVTRRKAGDRILVTDGKGLRCDVIIAATGKKSMEGEIVAHSFVEKPGTEVAVAFSLLRTPQRFDFFLEKATELGVSMIIPMITGRTVSLPSNEKIDGKLTRWGNIVLSASKQSKRFYFPRLDAPLHFREVLGIGGFDNRLMPFEGASVSQEGDYSGKKTLFLIGGEGGFTPNEVDDARDAGFSVVSLGKTILRAETAAIFAVAMVRARLLAEEREAWM